LKRRYISDSFEITKTLFFSSLFFAHGLLSPLGGPVLKFSRKYSDFRQTGDKHWGGVVSLNRKIIFYQEFDTFIILQACSSTP